MLASSGSRSPVAVPVPSTSSFLLCGLARQGHLRHRSHHRRLGLAFLALCLSIFLFVRRMRQRRRQQEALLEAALAPAAPPAAPPDDGAGLNPTDEEVVHHAWHIRTQPDPTPPGAGADAEQEEQDARNIGAPEHEQPGQHAGEQRAQVDQRDQPDISSEHPRQRPGPRGRSFGRVASMDSPSPVASAEEAPEHEQAGGEKQGTGGAAAVCCEVSPGSDRLNRAAMKRSLSAGSR
ncbi:E3 ubiquitin-protein ligase RING1-like [Panicum miliaceum]|uniref:E3 ubiquitin-protein ligase RING1-like n=1 Tax=Panicum miliaceum TaxID=4540 RepID=A0A3L6QII8_PANMI|nr:E3 ubiquitin-protein ligase RING1-like [Panicum miliaceum]